MKLRVALCCAVLSGLCVTGAKAFPPMPGHVKEAFKDDKDYKPFLETVEALKTKCDVCHKPGADKADATQGRPGQQPRGSRQPCSRAAREHSCR